MINIVGLGYIGLPLAFSFAANGIKVTGTDCNINLLKKLRSGEIPFEEKGLYELWEQAKNNIVFTEKCIEADIYIIAVPTPYDKNTKRIDASYVVTAVHDVLEAAPKGSIIVLESTVSPGTIDKYIRPAVEKAGFIAGDTIHIAHSPERIIPGNLVNELVTNSRTIGADSLEIAEKIKAVYGSFCTGEIICTDIRTAEMTKIVENTFRDINIAFANELAKICREGSLDVHEIIRIANKHPRVNILNPGPGVGGHCISVDPWFLVGDYPILANLVKTARQINDSMPHYVLERTVQIMKETGITDLSKVGFYGLTYKENVDDVRESPTMQLLDAMRIHMAPSPKVYDPYIKKAIVPNQVFSLDEFLNGLDIVVIMVAHDEIIEKANLLESKVVFDTRNIVKITDVYKL